MSPIRVLLSIRGSNEQFEASRLWLVSLSIAERQCIALDDADSVLPRSGPTSRTPQRRYRLHRTGRRHRRGHNEKTTNPPPPPTLTHFFPVFPLPFKKYPQRAAGASHSPSHL